ncbi:MAG: hypothetical protein M3Y59_24475 [Myxococcota bacterium]|nr:hypothetical protein [Myxococcota bacterium]
MRGLIITTLVAALAAGCSPPKDQPATLEPVATPGGDLPVLPDPDLQGGNVGRAPRRITVEQLRRSIEAAAGRPWTGLASVADSLGEADFAMVVSDSAEPNLVFAKFLEDGARSVCVAQANADLAASTASARILARQLPDSLTNLTTLTDEQIAANLVYLSTRFWGWPLEGAELQQWTALFRQLATRAQAVGKRAHALAGVCIALFTDPRFSTY